jgi:hypothetical protein
MEASNKESLNYHVSYARFKEMQKKLMPFEFKPSFTIQGKNAMGHNKSTSDRFYTKYKKRNFITKQDQSLPLIKRVATKPPRPMKENVNSLANITTKLHKMNRFSSTNQISTERWVVMKNREGIECLKFYLTFICRVQNSRSC